MHVFSVEALYYSDKHNFLLKTKRLGTTKFLFRSRPLIYYDNFVLCSGILREKIFPQVMWRYEIVFVLTIFGHWLCFAGISTHDTHLPCYSYFILRRQQILRSLSALAHNCYRNSIHCCKIRLFNLEDLMRPAIKFAIQYSLCTVSKIVKAKTEAAFW